MKLKIKRLKYKIRTRLYSNLSRKLTAFIPEEYRGFCDISHSIMDPDDKDRVVITLNIPHELTKKLMWSMKAWRAD